MSNAELVGRVAAPEAIAMTTLALHLANVL